MGIRPFLSVVLVLLAASELSGQSTSFGDRLGWDVGVAFLASAPDGFESPSCGDLWAVTPEVGGRLDVAGPVLLESSVGLSLQRPVSCSLADLLIPPDDGSLTRRVYSDGVDRNPSVTTAHRLVLDPRARDAWGPRVSVGVGRFWGKGVGYWSIGLGLRVLLRGAPVLVEAERIDLRVPFVDETSTWSNGELVSVDRSDERKLRDAVWAIRVRIPVLR